MAAKTKTKSTSFTKYKKKAKVHRPGRHSKKKSSNNKKSKHYKKPYNRQGK